MRYDKWGLIFVVINMLLVVGSLTLGFYAYQAAGRYFAPDVVFVAPFRGDSYFAIDNTRIIPNASLESRGRVTISRNDRQVITPVVFCESDYFSLHFKIFIEGAPWPESENDVPNIVLNEVLTWYLFGGNDIVGLTVRVGDEFHRVTGVVRQSENNRTYMAWLPIGTIRTRPIRVTAMYLTPYPYSPINARADAISLLGNRNLTEYAIVDINQYIENMHIRHRVLLYAVWLYVAVLLFGALKRCSIRNFGEVKRLVLILVGVGVCLYVLMGVNDIILWLPNLADPNVSVFSSISNAGALPPDIYLSYGLSRISQLNRLGNFVWGAGAVGLINLTFIIKSLSTVSKRA